MEILGDGEKVVQENSVPSLFGVVNVYKPVGMTSHDVVSKLRRATKIKQIGHTGTLDPFAEGVLPICIGKATRLIEYFEDDKAYIATVQFGKSTTTYDIEGDVVKEFDKKVSYEDIENALENFEGEIFQIPPIYSAIKVNGKKLYDYARSGQSVKIEPRKVFIDEIKLQNFDELKQVAEILVRCSKGTYIRSIANDLGEILACGGYLTKLVRIKAGRCLVENSVRLEHLTNFESVKLSIINPIEMLPFKQVIVDDMQHKKIMHGQALKNFGIKHGDFVILIYNENVNAIGVADEDFIKIKKVF